MERYLNPFTDFGFKKIFGAEENQDILVSFLNQVLPDKKIHRITYRKTEHLGQRDLDRKVIFDLYCENETGEKFIVELQKAKQTFFKDRTLFYSTFPIQEQAQKGTWNYELKAVYTVAILDFYFDDEHKRDVKVHVKLMDTLKKTVFYDKLSFLYLQMPNFSKSLEELSSLEDKWLFVLKNLDKLEEIPVHLQEDIFEKVFKIAEIAKLDEADRRAYEDSLKYYRDVKNSLDTAFEEGKELGLQEGEYRKAVKTAEKLLKNAFDVGQVAELTELSVQQVQEMAKNLGL